MSISISATAPEPFIQDMLSFANDQGIEHTEPYSAKALPDTYRSPFGIPPDQLEHVLRVIGLIIGMAGGLIGLVDKLLDLVKKHRTPVLLMDEKNPKDKLHIDLSTGREEIEDWLKRRQ